MLHDLICVLQSTASSPYWARGRSHTNAHLDAHQICSNSAGMGDHRAIEHYHRQHHSTYRLFRGEVVLDSVVGQGFVVVPDGIVKVVLRGVGLSDSAERLGEELEVRAVVHADLDPRRAPQKGFPR